MIIPFKNTKFMALSSSKDILSTYNFLSPQEKKKHAHFEFQAFAYRLAHDLNDLVNLRIYLRLAKNMERSLMERAYSYAIDSNTDNKAKVFLWKLKEIRKQIQKHQDSQNFDYDFVVKRMKVFRNKTVNPQIKAYDEGKVDLVNKLISLVELKPKSKALVLTLPSIKFIDKLYDNLKKVYVLDLSNQINQKLEIPFLENHKKISFKTTDFLKTKLKENTFRYIYIDSYWNFLPRDSELKFFEIIKKIMKSDGTLYLNVKKAAEATEEWKDMKIGDVELPYFTKTTSRKSLNTVLEKVNLKSKKLDDYGNFELLEISKITQ